MKLALVAFLSLAFGQAHAYYGRNSVEAELVFSATINLPWKAAIPSIPELNRKGALREKTKGYVHKQILFVDGVFHSAEFARRWGGSAGAGPWYDAENYEVIFTEVLGREENGRLTLRYDFKGKVVVQKDPLRRKERAPMDLWLPKAPDRIHELAKRWGKNQCTDRLEDQAADFYYYWDPFRPSCRLRQDHPESIQWLTGEAVRLPNTRLSYPEYDALFKDREPDAKLEVAIFYGYISHGVKSKRPFFRDDGFQAMRQMGDNLLRIGFTETERKPSFQVDKSGAMIDGQGVNVLRRFERIGRVGGRDLKIRLTMLLSNTELNSKDPTFHSFLKPALRDADILMYDGHSGDGEVLDLNKIGIAPIKVTKEQIIYLNACDTYMNYLGQFTGARGGLHKLDLILSGMPTLTSVSAENDWAFLEPFLAGKRLSYQEILERIDRSNGREGTFLMGVVGDETNTWRPR